MGRGRVSRRSSGNGAGVADVADYYSLSKMSWRAWIWGRVKADPGSQCASGTRWRSWWRPSRRQKNRSFARVLFRLEHPARGQDDGRGHCGGLSFYRRAFGGRRGRAGGHLRRGAEGGPRDVALFFRTPDNTSVIERLRAAGVTMADKDNPSRRKVPHRRCFVQKYHIRAGGFGYHSRKATRRPQTMIRNDKVGCRRDGSFVVAENAGSKYDKAVRWACPCWMSRSYY